MEKSKIYTCIPKEGQPLKLQLSIKELEKEIEISVCTQILDIPLKTIDRPWCGIVALSMASRFFSSKPISPDDILYVARTKNFTNKGEMFSAYDMAALASSVMNCNATVLEDVVTTEDEILCHLARGLPVLFPYDSDIQGKPIANQGRSAHWALLTGLRVITTNSDVSLDGMIPNCDSRLADSGSTFFDAMCSSGVFYINSAENIYVFYYESKQRRMDQWKFDEFVKSNKRLRKISNHNRTLNLVIHDPLDPLLYLRDKVVILNRTG